MLRNGSGAESFFRKNLDFSLTDFALSSTEVAPSIRERARIPLTKENLQ